VHEAALARDLLAAVVARAGGARVRVVHGWVAETESLSRESLAMHFTAHARGTVAEAARLELELVHVAARCRACGAIFAPEHHLVLCPACGGADAALLGETGLGLRALEVVET
jgi:hydrogenase nickel incorporation protein HypA/HybF